jgi:hypothetical protein
MFSFESCLLQITIAPLVRLSLSLQQNGLTLADASILLDATKTNLMQLPEE